MLPFILSWFISFALGVVMGAVASEGRYVLGGILLAGIVANIVVAGYLEAIP